MASLKGLKTSKGTGIVVHLEDESDINNLKKVLRKDLLYKLRLEIGRWDNGTLDTGEGTIHVLINHDASCVGVLGEKEFIEWDKNPEKNWNTPKRRCKKTPETSCSYRPKFKITTYSLK